MQRVSRAVEGTDHEPASLDGLHKCGSTGVVLEQLLGIAVTESGEIARSDFDRLQTKIFGDIQGFLECLIEEQRSEKSQCHRVLLLQAPGPGYNCPMSWGSTS